MKYLDLTFERPEHNLACDEALLEGCEDGGGEEEILRFWEPRQHFIVLGYSGKVDAEVDAESCRQHRIPILRRISGGGTVLQGPGCLNVTLILRMDKKKPLQNLIGANYFILRRHQAALKSLIGRDIEIQGLSDLTLESLKFSGNAQRRRRRFLLYHGTFLLSFDLELMEKLLPIPRRQPSYRADRPHRKFLTNLNVSQGALKQAIRTLWKAHRLCGNIPLDQIDRLVKERYSTPAWNLKF